MSLVVLTGAAHSGKTTLLRALAARGFPVVPEAALAVIDALGSDAAAWRERDPAAFQARISARQARAEAAARAASGTVTFVDRGLVDGVAYSALRGHPPPVDLLRALASAAYARVFLLEMILPFSRRRDTGRLDDEAFARALHEQLRAAWTAFGLAPVAVPALPVEERVALILSEMG